MAVREKISGISSVVLSAAELARAALGWWFTELGDLIPARVKTLFAGDGERLWLRFRDNTIHVERADGLERWQFPPGSAGELPASLQKVVADGAGAILFVPSEIILRRNVELPTAAASEIRSAISFLIDRLTPFRAEQTYYSTCLRKRDRVRKLLSVDLIVVPRERLDRLVAAAAAWRVPVSTVRIDGEPDADLHFMRKQSRTMRSNRLSRHAGRSVLAAGMALLVVGPLAVAYRVHQRAAALKAELAVAEVGGRRAAALRSEVETRVVEHAFLPTRQRSLRPIETLDELSRALPDDSWLFSMELRPGQVVLAGLSSNVPALVERLSKPPFSGPELIAPVVNGISGGKARFELRLQVMGARS